ncbi:MAG: alpha-galactosidase [Planctomycetes bacterium]|nr:alpha-galactosidase [Planctomycetota bacterium]
MIRTVASAPRRLFPMGCAFVLVAIAWPCALDGVEPTKEELAVARAFHAERLGSSDPARLPFSFRYGGKSSRELLARWRREETRETLDAARTRRSIVHTDPDSGLRVRCDSVEYADFPVAEWTLVFSNPSAEPSALIEDVRALDVTFIRAGETEFLLHHAYGSQANRSDYGPRETPLAPGAAARFGGAGGRPTNVDWSYFNLQFGAEGAIAAVGWPGQWNALFTRDAENGLRVEAGQELVHTRLLPNEEFRSPLTVLLFWQGEYLRSQNVWRRWMTAHSMPKPGGKLPPPQFVASSSRAYEEMIKANEQNQIMHIDRYLEEGLKLDYWWMDAGWYIQQQGWPQVGTWEVDPARFPRGFKPISDHAHARGVKTLVWFEPERVAPGTWLYREHPEWLLHATPPESHPLSGMVVWSSDALGTEPCVVHNGSPNRLTMAGIVWDPGRLSFHPGGKGEYGVVRWTAAESGEYAVTAAFAAIDPKATTDVHVAVDGRTIYDGQIQVDGKPGTCAFEGKVSVDQGRVIDFIVGWGNGSHPFDSTGLDVQIRRADADPNAAAPFDAARDFHAAPAPKSPWSYGWLPPAPSPDLDPKAFHPFERPRRPGEEGTRLLNLGDDRARVWLTDHVDRLLTEQGIDLYRQDFNMDPLGFWRANDAEDRQGMTENRHVTGYLAYWDELRRRHPDMLIDSCASGGRRNDLETMRRAVPLWRSDYAYEPIGHQCMTYGISLWLPYHGTGTVASSAAPYYGGGFTEVEPYAFWSNAAPSLGSGIDVRVPEIDYKKLRELYAEWRKLSEYYSGDFYPLTPYSQSDDAWIAWQFHLPERGTAAVQAFRRQASATETARLKLHDLVPDATYRFASRDGAAEGTASGRELMVEGLPIALPAKPSAAVIFVQRQAEVQR